MRTQTRRSFALLLLATLLFGGAAGCASMTGTQKGAVIGAGAGAAVGGLIGRANGSTAVGAIAGAAVGGTVGALIGRQMDKQADELAQEIPGAKIERVGEGILVTFDSGILFDFNSDALKTPAMENLRNLAASLQKYPKTNVMLVGHTDAVGSDQYNQGLSERRARSAASFLASQGVTSARITANGRGEIEPVATNDTDFGREQNRRVEVAIFASEEYKRELRGTE